MKILLEPSAALFKLVMFEVAAKEEVLHVALAVKVGVAVMVAMYAEVVAVAPDEIALVLVAAELLLLYIVPYTYSIIPVAWYIRNCIVLPFPTVELNGTRKLFHSNINT